jgi:hypothetical protein
MLTFTKAFIILAETISVITNDGRNIVVSLADAASLHEIKSRQVLTSLFLNAQHCFNFQF